jgi:8-oxo-dGTP diphosphatase
MATLARDLAYAAAKPSRPSRPARPKVAVDTILFAIEGGGLRCYLVRLKRGPNRGKWAFPGGLVRVGEMLDAAARRQLHISTGLADCYLEQLFTFGDPTRDPRAHVVSVGYMALIDGPGRVKSCSRRYAHGDWFEPARMPPLAYDHALMAEYAVKRLKAKLEYTNIASNLLPPKFTFAELEELYGAVLARRLDRRNFRRRILAMGLLKRLPQERRGAHRPAALYALTRRSLQLIEML